MHAVDTCSLRLRPLNATIVDMYMCRLGTAEQHKRNLVALEVGQIVAHPAHPAKPVLICSIVIWHSGLNWNTCTGRMQSGSILWGGGGITSLAEASSPVGVHPPHHENCWPISWKSPNTYRSDV